MFKIYSLIIVRDIVQLKANELYVSKLSILLLLLIKIPSVNKYVYKSKYKKVGVLPIRIV